MPESHPSPFLRYIRHLVGSVPAAAMTDGQLLERFLAERDETAIELLVRRYGPLVLGVCRRVLRDNHAAEDAFQATFLVLMRKAPSLDRGRPLGNWLYTVAYRLALTARANELRRQRCEEQAARRRPSTEDRVRGPSDLIVALEEELQKLPERHRAPLVLCYLEGKTNEQAAQVLGCPRGSISARLAQARERLRACLARRGHVVPSVAIATLLTSAAAEAAVLLPLLDNTVRAALWFVREEAGGTGFVSARAVELARGACQAMFVHKLKIAAVVLAAVAMLGTGTTMLLKSAPQASPPIKSDEQSPPETRPGRAEVLGEHLPKGVLARMGSTQLRHGDGIFFAAFTPDGKALLTAGKDQTIRLWDLATRKEIRRFDRGEAKADGESAPTARGEGRKPKFSMRIDQRVSAALGMDFKVALSPDGQFVAATRAGTVHLWRTKTGEKLHELKTGQSDVAEVVFSADGESLLSLGPDRSISVWQVASGKRTKEIAGPGTVGQEEGTLVAVSPGLKYVAWVQVDPVSQSMSLKVMDLTTGKELSKAKLSAGGAFNMAFSPDDKLLASAGFLGGIELWDVAEGKQVRRLGGGLGLSISEPVTALAFSLDGKTLAASRTNNTIELWDLQTGKRTHRIGEPTTEQNGMSILVDGMAAMTRSALTFSPDGKKLIASLGGAMIRQFDVGTGKEISDLSGGHRASISMLRLSADGKSLLTYGRGDPVRFWSLTTGEATRQLPLSGKVTGAAFSASGQFASAVGKNVLLCDAAGKEIRKVEAGKLAVEALALSPDGSVLAVRNVLNPLVDLWDAATGKKRATLGQAGESPKGGGLLVAETAGVVPPDLVFSPDGRFLAGAGPKRQLCLWDVAAGASLWEIAPAAGKAIERFTFSASGRCLATLNSDSTVTLYETATGEPRGQLGQAVKNASGNGLTVSVGGLSLALSNRRDAPVCLAFSPDGRYLAAAKDTPEIHLWDMLAGREVGRLKGHEGGVVSLLLTPDGKRLISGSTDTTALTWDVQALTRGGPARAGKLDGSTLETLWKDLAAPDAVRAFEAISKLNGSPTQAVALIRERVHPVASADEKRLARLVADLESDRFEVRKMAESELEGLGELAGAHLRKVLNDEPSLELRQRVNRLLRKLSGPTPSSLVVRDLRAVEMLELIGDAQARGVLEILARGAPDARLTREAKAAVERLTKRAALAP